MKSIYKTLGLVIALVIICARFAFAYPSWYDPEKGIGFKPSIPDFYQHQSYKTDPEWENGGWCWPTAFVNSLYWWDKNSYDSLFEETPDTWTDDKIKDGKWTDDMIKDMKTNIKKTATNMFTDGMSMTGILKDRGHPPEKPPLFVTRYKWDNEKVTSYAENGTENIESYLDDDSYYRSETKYSSMFQLYKDELLRCEDILIRIIDPTYDHRRLDPSDPLYDCNYKPNWWWSSSYHMLTGVGIEFKTCQETEGKIWFADPNDTYHDQYDKDMTWNYTAKEWEGGWNDPYKVDDKLPFGEEHYDWAKIGKDGTLLEGYYKGAKISRIYATSPVPEPATLFLLGSGLAGIVGFGRKRLFKKS